MIKAYFKTEEPQKTENEIRITGTYKILCVEDLWDAFKKGKSYSCDVVFQGGNVMVVCFREDEKGSGAHTVTAEYWHHFEFQTNQNQEIKCSGEYKILCLKDFNTCYTKYEKGVVYYSYIRFCPNRKEIDGVSLIQVNEKNRVHEKITPDYWQNFNLKTWQS